MIKVGETTVSALKLKVLIRKNWRSGNSVTPQIYYRVIIIHFGSL